MILCDLAEPVASPSIPKKPGFAVRMCEAKARLEHRIALRDHDRRIDMQDCMSTAAQQDSQGWRKGTR